MGFRDVFRPAPKPVARGFVGPAFTLQDPALAEYIGVGAWNDAGVNVSEASTLGISAVWGAVGLIADTIASLPLCSYKVDPAGNVNQIPSLMDDPGMGLYTPYEWKALIATHMALWGEAFLLHVYTAAGTLAGLVPIHPSLVNEVKRDQSGAKTFIVHLQGESTAREYTEQDMTQIMYRTADGLRGLSPIRQLRNVLGIAIAGEKSAARFYANGFMLGGLIVPKEELTERQGEQLMAQMKAKMSGAKNAGDWHVINASLEILPMSISAKDAQFLESRQYSVTEVCRIWGVPKVLLAEDGASTWGTGVAEIVRGWQKFTLVGYTERIAERLSALLQNKAYCEFEYKALLQGDPIQETASVISQYQAGLLTVDEARLALGRGPMPAAPEVSPPGGPAGDVMGDSSGSSL